MKNILVTTVHRGVFFAQVDDNADLTSKEKLVNLKNCRMAIYFGTTKGVLQLAETGPTASSKIGSRADIDVLHDITGVFSVTDKAAEIWMKD